MKCSYIYNYNGKTRGVCECAGDTGEKSLIGKGGERKSQ